MHYSGLLLHLLLCDLRSALLMSLLCITQYAIYCAGLSSNSYTISDIIYYYIYYIPLFTLPLIRSRSIYNLHLIYS